MMRRLPIALIASAALAWPLAVHAADKPAPAVDDSKPAATPGDDTTASEDAPNGDIVIIGKGESRQIQRISSADIDILAAGTSPLKAIQKLPGVNYQGADPFGAYEWAERISIRGFNQNQLGFTLDGIPLGDGSYGNTNGLHISRAISSENIGETRVSEGAGSIGTQATNNLGGTVEFFSSDPMPETALTLNGTYGSDNAVRAFGRLDTGVLGEGGPSAYVSYTFSDTDKWKGWGSQRQNQVNAKFIAPLTPGVRFSGTFDFSARRENDYQDMSLEMIRRLGYNWDNISNNYAQAVQIAQIAANRSAAGLGGGTGTPVTNPAAGTVYPGAIQTADDTYYNAAGLRNDYLASLGFENSEGSAIKFNLKGYYHSNHGQGLWYTPYVPSPSGVPLSVRTTEYDIRRKGVFGSVGGDLGAFGSITAGGWYERNNFRQARRFYDLNSLTGSTRDSLQLQDGAFATQWDFKYKTDTLQYYVEDKLKFGPLTVNLGWKGYDVKLAAAPIVSGGLASGRIKTTDWFQPHAGFTFKLSDQAELFGGFTEVTRAFAASATVGPFATTQQGFDALGKLKPETSDTFELGSRVRSGIFTGSLAAYYVDFKNRLLAFSNGAGIIGNPAVLQNVGSVRSLGIEATGQIKLPGGFGAFASYAYNDSTYRNNVFDATGAIVSNTKDKTVADAPKHIASGEITYDGQVFFGRFGANYMSKRFFTYENDQSVAGRVLFDATIGARVTLDGRKFEIQGNATNLFDKKYIATIGTNGFGNSGDSQTLMVGAPQQFFVTVKTRF